MKYSLDVVPPPQGQDAVDYFLSDSQTGYCDYFASAMAVMLRSVGVPARVASGYARGTQDAPGGQYVVRDNNAHSWVEVYFPRYGWVEFDPSPSQPQLAQPFGATEPTPTPEPTQAPTASPDSPNQDQRQQDPSRDLPSGAGASPGGAPDGGGPWLGMALSAALLGLVAAAGALLWRAPFAGLPAPAAAYARVAQLASLLGWGSRPTETPREFADRLGRVAPHQAQALTLISDAFAAFRFGRQPPGPGDRSVLDAAWQRARGGLLGAAVRRILATVSELLPREAIESR
jgi:hypothetical protein